VYLLQKDRCNVGGGHQKRNPVKSKSPEGSLAASSVRGGCDVGKDQILKAYLRKQ
jgi:hypothetical protein